MSFSLQHIAQHLSAELRGDPQCEIKSIAPLDKAVEGQISFLTSPQYRSFLSTTRATALILSPKDASVYSGNCLIMANPYLGYAKAATLFIPSQTARQGVHPTAVIGQDCHIAPSASIAAGCVIGDDVSIGDNTILGPGCSVGDHSSLGSGTVLYAHVTLYHRVQVGDGVILHSGVVIGADGFGFVPDEATGHWYKIPQLGGVRIGHAVEIGANTTIDRGALEDTIIEEGVKLDNLIQIAHNVRIGAHTVIAGGTMIAGSVDIGKHCMIGGGCAISGHLQMTDGVILTAKTEIGSSISQPGVYSSGMPSQPNLQWRKNIVRFTQLDQIARRLKKLETRMERAH
jgi:UDP-3-O-[3-hydroxymyristoyl] glucosamine N-acyltransferase